MQCLLNIVNVYTWIINFNQQLNNLTATVNNATADMSTAYNSFRTSDNSIIGLERQFNWTIGNFSNSIISTMGKVNATLFNATKTINTTLVTSYGSLSSAVPTTVVTDFVAALNQSAISISNSILSNLQALNNSLYTRLTTINATVLGAYPNVSQWTAGRSAIINAYLANKTLLTCAAAAVNSTESSFTAMGGAAMIYNCTNVESSFMSIVQQFVTSISNIFAFELAIDSGSLKNCTYPSLGQTSNSTVQYSKTDCVGSVSSYTRILLRTDSNLISF
jgi:hypothetical protein